MSGAIAVGSTLAVSRGNWSRAPTGYAYQWERCWVGLCEPIAGATSPGYTVAPADSGASLEVLVTATNTAGSTRVNGIFGAPQAGGSSPSAPSATSPVGGGTAAAPPPPPSRPPARRAAQKRKARVHATRRGKRRRGWLGR